VGVAKVPDARSNRLSSMFPSPKEDNPRSRRFSSTSWDCKKGEARRVDLKEMRNT